MRLGGRPGRSRQIAEAVEAEAVVAVSGVSVRRVEDGRRAEEGQQAAAASGTGRVVSVDRVSRLASRAVVVEGSAAVADAAVEAARGGRAAIIRAQERSVTTASGESAYQTRDQ